MSLRIAHVSDVHVLDLTGTKPWRFLNKRITGLANLMGARKAAHPHSMLEQIVRELEGDDVDHVIISGDLSNLALESELSRARELVKPLGGFDRVSVVPGNHDVYTRGAQRSRRFERFFGDLMWRGGEAQAYPWFKDLGPVKLVGFSSANATAPLFAHGHVARAQLDRLASLHREGALDGGFGVGVVHHNLHRRGRRKDWMHGLRNRDELVAACKSAGVGLILHGHTHVSNRFEQDGIAIVGSGSSTWSSPEPRHTGRYNVYTVDEGGVRDTEVRVFDAGTGAFGGPARA
ncbi:MAG: metallophosphoesterase [Deltaproteobacteria bacterium]|nr:metallophosphoesterase [Deltaproteobacteria bacterium]